LSVVCTNALLLKTIPGLRTMLDQLRTALQAVPVRLESSPPAERERPIQRKDRRGRRPSAQISQLIERLEFLG
jgi:hypothetical protein